MSKPNKQAAGIERCKRWIVRQLPLDGSWAGFYGLLREAEEDARLTGSSVTAALQNLEEGNVVVVDGIERVKLHQFIASDCYTAKADLLGAMPPGAKVPLAQIRAAVREFDRLMREGE